MHPAHSIIWRTSCNVQGFVQARESKSKGNQDYFAACYNSFPTQKLTELLGVELATTMGDRSPAGSPGGERYSPQRSYTQSRSRSPDGRGRSYTPERDEKVSSTRQDCMLFDRRTPTAFGGANACMLTARLWGGSHGRLTASGAAFSFDVSAHRVSQISTIYVGGISFDTDERALQNYFQKFGNVTEVKVWPLTATDAPMPWPPAAHVAAPAWRAASVQR